MHYVIGDIHNEAIKLKRILHQINIKKNDELIVLGDIFDRGGSTADPVEVYFTLSAIKGKCTWIRGNHDQWLADYIDAFYSKLKKGRKKMTPYNYNSFDLMRERLTDVDIKNIADQIHKLPLQMKMEINGKRYLFAHAMTSHPNTVKNPFSYMMGGILFDNYIKDGVDGYVSFVGHTPTANVVQNDSDLYLDDYLKSIWKNEKGNVILMDCGSGFASGRLACICIETGERFYSR